MARAEAGTSNHRLVRCEVLATKLRDMLASIRIEILTSGRVNVSAIDQAIADYNAYVGSKPPR